MKLASSKEQVVDFYESLIVFDKDKQPNIERTAKKWIREFWLFIAIINSIGLGIIGLLIYEIIETIKTNSDWSTVIITIICLVAIEGFEFGTCYVIRKKGRIHPFSYELTLFSVKILVRYIEFFKEKLETLDEEFESIYQAFLLIE